MSRYLTFDEDSLGKESYDLEGLLNLADSQEAALVFMLKEEDEEVYIRNRYTVLSYERGWNGALEDIKDYLEQEEGQSLFIGFAALYEDKLLFLEGRGVEPDQLACGEVELGENRVYGVCISLSEENYLFEEVLYYDGQEKEQSVAIPLQETGDLGSRLRYFIQQYC